MQAALLLTIDLRADGAAPMYAVLFLITYHRAGSAADAVLFPNGFALVNFEGAKLHGDVGSDNCGPGCATASP